MAQEQAARPAEPSAVSEVVVTARRTEENIQKIPLAVSAHTGEQINQLVVNTIQDLNKLSPGLQVSAASGTRNTNQPSIRGQGTSFGTGQSSVIGYLAEVPNFQASVMDLASVQVVKGPQGTLFGATATGGVILYEPTRPNRNELNGYVTGELGNYSYKSLEAALGGAIIPDQLFVRGAFKLRRRDGFTTAVQSWGGTTDFDNIDQNEWRLSVLWRPTTNLENYFLYAGSRNSSNGESSPIGYVDNNFMNPSVRNLPPSLIAPFAAAYEFQTGVAPPPGQTFAQLQSAAWAKQIAAGPRTTFVNYNHHNAQKFDGIVDQARWDINDYVTVRNIFGIQWRSARGPSIEVDGTDVPLVDTRNVVKVGSTNLYDPDYAWVGGNPARAISDELQFQGKLFDNRLNWQLGAYGSWLENSDFTPISVISAFTNPSPPDPVNNNTPPGNNNTPPGCVTVLQVTAGCLSTLTKSKIDDQAIYGQATYAVTDTIHLTAGARHSWASREVTSALTNSFFVNFKGFPQPLAVDGRSPIAGTESTQTNPTEQKNTYTLAADWQATDNLLLYATGRTGYKPGGINQNAPANDPHRSFGPETLEDIEIGAKLDWSIGSIRGRTNLALYHDKYKDIQTSSIIPGTATTITINAAQATIQGAELESTVSFADWFEVSGWYAYLDAKYDTFKQTFACHTLSEYWYAQCATTPAAVGRQLTVDNASGTVTIFDPAGTVATFAGTPTTFANAAKHTFSVKPTVHLKPWLDQDLSVTANVQYSSSMQSLSFPGVALAPAPAGSGVPSKGPFYMPSRVVVDMHVDWKNVMGTKLNLSLVGTNITNRTYNISNASGFTIIGAYEYIYNEPRMYYVELTYPIGGE